MSSSPSKPNTNTTATTTTATNKYDRQLRLWGPSGQRLLSTAHVCLINASATGTETLKNLVLPGVGHFTIVDHHIVNETDIGNNFFLEPTKLGQQRGIVARDLLCELNPDVNGVAIIRSPQELDTSFFSRFTLVIATQLDEKTLSFVADACWKSDIPLVVARTYGFIGYVRLCTREHCIIESKITSQPDLRICNPFPQLRALVNSLDLTKLDEMEFKHVPFVLILIQLLDSWKQTHQGNPPKTFDEKQKFREQIMNLKREPWGSEENLVEAHTNAFLAFTPKTPNDTVKMICSEADGKNLNSSTSNFWIMVMGLSQFLKHTHGVLPLEPSLPDMTSTTSNYITLQRAFKEKSLEDVGIFSKFVDELLIKIGHSPESISLADRTLFCANAHALHVIRHTSLLEEWNNSSHRKIIQQQLVEGDPDEIKDPAQNPFIYYLLLRACDRMYHSNKKYPGEPQHHQQQVNSSYLETEQKQLFHVAKSLAMDEYGLPENLVPTLDHAMEMVRYGGVELHNIASFVGGVASQEIVKLITKQFIPLNNTFIYNGIDGVGKSLAL
jgi:amyloid beta precursor protein binding protein 1